MGKHLEASQALRTTPALPTSLRRNARSKAADDFFSTIEKVESSSKVDDALATKLKSSSADMYNQLAARAPRFWNWGFHRDDVHAEIQKRLPDYHFETDGFSEQLYYYMARQVPVDSHAGMTVLEVGCGAGNGLNFLSRVFGFESAIGVDLSAGAVRAANARFARTGLRFLEGDAEHLPIGDAEVDLVLNVESSHCYPSPSRFMKEVARVLKPGGYFAHADAFTRERWGLFERAKRDNASFDWVTSADISPQVKDAISRRMAPDSLVRRFIQQRKPSLWSSARQRTFFPLIAHEVLVLRTFGSRFAGYEHGIQEKLVNVLSSDRSKDYHARVETYFYQLGRKS